MKKRDMKKFNNEMLQIVLKHGLKQPLTHPIQFLYKMMYSGEKVNEVCFYYFNEYNIQMRTIRHKFISIENTISRLKIEANALEPAYIRIGLFLDQ